MRRLRRWLRQWRESWADAAYDDVREEIVRLHTLNLALQASVRRLESRIARIEMTANSRSA